jgi:hypothetical protein
MKLYIEIQLGNEAMVAGANVAKAIENSFRDAERNMFEPLQVSDEGIVIDANGNSVGRWDVLTSDSETELSPSEREAEHERGYHTGYRAAIHDARVPGSVAHHELNTPESKARIEAEAALAAGRKLSEPGPAYFAER